MGTTVNPNRFEQLTYTSFDDAATRRGGWQVKESTPGLAPHEQNELASWVKTSFDIGDPLGKFPTPAEIEAAPRRLVYAPLAGQCAYWHTAAAGIDGSGRPGNVFAHIQLDRTPRETEPAFRPIETWRSADWLTPYNADAVKNARLPAVSMIRPGPAVTRAAVTDFIRADGGQRISTLQVVLDSVVAALAGGKIVVLGVQDPESAAFWIGAVSHLMSPGTSRVFGWSTHDRANDIAQSRQRGLHLTAVPLDELSQITEPGCIRIDETERPQLGDLGHDGHLTSHGDSVAVTEWSRLAGALFYTPRSILAALDKQDSLAAVHGDTNLHPAWSLGQAMLAVPELKRHASRYTSALEAELIRSATPPPPVPAPPAPTFQYVAPRASPEYAGSDHAEAAYERPEAWSRAAAVQPTEDWQLPEARKDDSWAPPADNPFAQKSSPIAVAIESVRRQALIAHTVAEKHAAACAVLHAANVLVSGRSGPGENDSAEVLRDLIERSVIPLLTDPEQAPGVLADVGYVEPLVLAEFVTPILAGAARDQASQSSTLTRAVIDWALDDRPIVPPGFRSLVSNSAQNLNDADLVLAAERELGRITTNTDAADADASLALWWLLARAPDAPHRMLTAVLAAREWDAGDLALADDQFGTNLSRQARPVPSDRPVSRRDSAESWSAVRDSHWTSMSASEFSDFAQNHVDGLLEELTTITLAMMGTSDRANLAALDIACVMRSASPPKRNPIRDHLLRMVLSEPTAMSEKLSRAISDRVEDQCWIAGASLLSRIHSESALPLTDPFLSVALTGYDVRRRTHWTSQIVTALRRTGAYQGPATTDALRDSAWLHLRQLSARTAETFFRVYERPSKSWLGEHDLDHRRGNN